MGILNFLQVFVPSPITEIGASYSVIQHVKRMLGVLHGMMGSCVRVNGFVRKNLTGGSGVVVSGLCVC